MILSRRLARQVPRRAVGRLFVRGISVGGKEYPEDDWTNLPPSIAGLVGRNLHLQQNHPLSIVRKRIEDRLIPMHFTAFNDFSPIVSTYQNFDSLDFPMDHPGRSKSDTYYINKSTILRTHTSAHEIECFENTKTPGYIISADVYRRDTIDRTHYPGFHQMEGARTWAFGEDLEERIQADLDALPDSGIIVEDPSPPFHANNPRQPVHSERVCSLLGQHLKRTLEIIMSDLFNEARRMALEAGSTDADLAAPLKARWIEAFFPWTSPSWEIEIWWKGEWLEMCGCGVVQQSVYNKAGMPASVGWAFGVGLERAAMILFGIPDIRLFWSKDERFLNQFAKGQVSAFTPWSKYPAVQRDVAFWYTSDTALHDNDVMEVVRSKGGDLVENVSLIDEYTDPKTGRSSRCYRVQYQSMERSLTNTEVNEIHALVVDAIKGFGVEIR